MLGFIEFLEEIERSRQVAVIEPGQVRRLVETIRAQSAQHGHLEEDH